MEIVHRGNTDGGSRRRALSLGGILGYVCVCGVALRACEMRGKESGDEEGGE